MIKRITLGILAALAVYLTGAFIGADFNIANWETEGRGLCGMFMFVALGMVAFCPFIED